MWQPEVCDRPASAGQPAAASGRGSRRRSAGRVGAVATGTAVGAEVGALGAEVGDGGGTSTSEPAVYRRGAVRVRSRSDGAARRLFDGRPAWACP